MNITPLDIRKQTFGKGFGGYNREEVETFLEMVAETFERLNEANASLQNKVRELEASVDKYQQLEQTLQDTLVMAQKIADEATENARKEAQVIVKDAELKADRALEEAHQGVNKIKQETLTLRGERDAFIARIKGLCHGQLELLEIFSEHKEEAEPEAEAEEPAQAPPPEEEAAEPQKEHVALGERDK